MRAGVPFQNWPWFAAEISVIVMGVLLALTAQEIVQQMHSKEEVAEARVALDAQLIGTQFAALERIKSSNFIVRKLDRLDKLLEQPSLPSVGKFNIAPLRLWGTSAWDAVVASGVVAEMIPELRNLYADQFAFTAAMREMNQQEFETEADLTTIVRHSRLTDVSRDRLTQEVARLRSFNSIMTLAAGQWLDAAKPLRLQLAPEDRKDLAQVRPCDMPGGGS